MRTLEEIRQGYQDVVGMVHGMRRHQIEIAILVADIPDLLAELNTTQCAHAFVSDSLSYETTRFRAALAEKDAEIERPTAIVQFGRAANNSHLDEIIELRRMIELWKTADSKAVTAARAESARLYSVLEDAWYQFAYVDGNGNRWCGGLSTLEDIADVLEIEDV